jgi:integrase
MFDYAVELQLVTINPGSMVATRYIGKSRKRSRALSPPEIRIYLRGIYQSNIRRQFKLALHLLLLTLTRKSELLLAQWKDVDFELGEWLIPGENAKSARPHVIYLSTQAAGLFRELQTLAAGSVFVLPGRSSIHRPFAKNALNKALEGVSFEMPAFTVHDLRRTAATQLTEHGFASDVIEKSLAHEKLGIRGVYIVAEHAAERKRMLEWWGEHVNALMNESKVIIGNFAV